MWSILSLKLEDVTSVNALLTLSNSKLCNKYLKFNQDWIGFVFNATAMIRLFTCILQV